MGCGDASFLQNRSKLKKVLIFSLTLNLVLLMVSLIIGHINGWRFPSDQSGAALGTQCPWFDSNVSLPTDNICVSCDELGEYVEATDTFYDSIIKSKCGRKMCCYKDAALKRLLSRV